MSGVALVTGAPGGSAVSARLPSRAPDSTLQSLLAPFVKAKGGRPRERGRGSRSFRYPAVWRRRRRDRILRCCAHAVPMDLLDLASVRGAGERVLAEWGHVDVLVNNAYAQTVGNMDRVLDIEIDDAQAMAIGNYLHQLALIQVILPSMIKSGNGVVVNLASGSATLDPPAPPGEGGWGLSYAASKASFGRFAGAINSEYRGAGIKAFNLSPGFVITESGKARGGADAMWKPDLRPHRHPCPPLLRCGLQQIRMRTGSSVASWTVRN